MRARGLSANKPQAKASKSTLKSPTYAQHSAEPKKEPHKQKTKDPQTQTTKHVPQASFLETFPTYQTHLTFVIGG